MPAYLYKSVRVVPVQVGASRDGERRVDGRGGAPQVSSVAPRAHPVRTMPEQRCSGGMLGYVLIVVASPEA
jgi:hypothetical protein